MPVTGVAVSFAPSVEVLLKAKAQGCNVVLADAHPYFSYDTKWSNLPGVMSTVTASPVVARKRALIEAEGMAVLRLRSAWRAKYPDAAAAALATALGFSVLPGSAGREFVIASCGGVVGDHFARVQERLGVTAPRLLGLARQPARHIAITTGLLPPSNLRKVLDDPRVDTVIAGEVVEWEAGPYMQDAISSGRRASLILTGYAASLEPAAAAVTSWASKALSDLLVVHIPGGSPIWAPMFGKGAA